MSEASDRVLPTMYVDPVSGIRVPERRRGADRRSRLLRSLFYGGLFPRRLGGRRAADHYRPLVDWHGPGLLTSAILVLLLCAADALFTLKLITLGATEANPVMALFVYDDASRFTIVKMTLTGLGVIALVAIARFRVFGVVRVASLLHAVLGGYVALMGWHFWLLSRLA
ncbi:MAG: DUF5658 family protein [Steroidobacteraceae bacterium]|jgi:hypothetical protein|nr:DUF5658 family protein [Steroidobacteraceae bacterium]